MGNTVAAKARRPEVGLAPEKQDPDGRVMALSLPDAELSEEMQAYFAKCDEKIGFVPNVLRAYAPTRTTTPSSKPSPHSTTT